jgi:hypothetical protein
MTIAYSSTATFTAVAAAIGAGDVMAGAKEFPGIGGVHSPTYIKFVSSHFMIAHTALVASEAAYTLHLYSVTPPSAIADNAAWDIPVADRTVYLGGFTLGTPVDLGATCFVETAQTKIVRVPAGGSLWAYLVTAAGITPTATDRIVTLYAETRS